MVGSATFTIVTSIMSISAPVIMTAAASQSPEDPDLVLIAVLPLIEQCSITNTVLAWFCVLVKRCSLTGTMFETGLGGTGQAKEGRRWPSSRRYPRRRGSDCPSGRNGGAGT